MKFLVQTDIDIVETIGPLLNKAGACSAALEPTGKVQFDQESGSRREACRLLLSIKNGIYSQKTDSHPQGPCNKRHHQAFRCLVAVRDVWGLRSVRDQRVVSLREKAFESRK
jgi:hypothetical protein